MDTIGSYDAKAKLAELLDRVAEGQSILITRNGRPAAWLKPAPGGRQRPLEDVVRDLRTFNRGRRLGSSLRAAINDGRR